MKRGKFISKFAKTASLSPSLRLSEPEPVLAGEANKKQSRGQNPQPLSEPEALRARGRAGGCFIVIEGIVEIDKTPFNLFYKI